MAKESPIDLREVFVVFETIDGDALKYSKGKVEIRLQRVELAGGGMVPVFSHPIPLISNVEQDEIIIKTKRIGDLLVI